MMGGNFAAGSRGVKPAREPTYRPACSTSSKFQVAFFSQPCCLISIRVLIEQSVVCLGNNIASADFARNSPTCHLTGCVYLVS
jgi:hypothetical protein